MAQKIMMAPKGVNSAVIEGHEYKIGKDGKIKVVNELHVETLERHGFVESHEQDSPEEIDALIEGMDDKAELVTFIEERGGEADDSMGFKKLRRLARDAAAGKLTDED